MEKVCITGVTGYLGSGILKTFLDSEEHKFEIRGTVRDPSNEAKIKPLKDSLGDRFDKVELVAADLLDAKSIEKAIEGGTYVVHTASPFPVVLPKDENKLIKPAVEGTKAVLEACRKHKVKRLVVTSSIAAILDYTRDKDGDEVNEEHWLEDLDHARSYPKSKALAEREVWKFQSSLPESERFDIVTINPGFIVGPILIKGKFSSAMVISKTMRGKYPGMPDVYMSLVDVRDVAEAHLRAITHKVPSGRYVGVEDTYECVYIGQTLHEEFRKYGYKPVNKKASYCVMKMAACFVAEAKSVIDSWGLKISPVNKLIKDTMKLEFKPAKDSLVDMGYSLIEQGYVPDKIKK